LSLFNDSRRYVEARLSGLGQPFFVFSGHRLILQSLGMKKTLNEGDFLFDVLLQIAIERFARHSSDCQSVGFELALESLAIQISKAAQSLILEG